MKPFIYNFLEPVKDDFSQTQSLIQYSKDLNLSVLKETNRPAIELPSLGTQTFTKANLEGSDADNNFQSAATMTATRASLEGSDSDVNRNMLMSAGTRTVTLAGGEGFDTESNVSIANMLSTRTLTEAKETTDSDR